MIKLQNRNEVKKLLLLSGALCLLTMADAQTRCYTDDVEQRAVQRYPELKLSAREYQDQLIRAMKGLDFNKLSKTTATYADMGVTYHVPIVFHIVHDYGNEYLSDNAIYEVVAEMNRFYKRQNPDTAAIIGSYAGLIPGTNVKYAGKANIEFHLANRDPDGNPTHGITRRRSYLTDNGGDQAKMDLWPPDQYINIWLIRVFDEQHSEAAAYAYKPNTAANYPFVYWDGVIGLASAYNTDNTLSHEIGHVLSLDHPWGGTNQPEVACGDDGVDDTPPTLGHLFGGCTDLTKIYDSKCVLTPFTLGNSAINLLKATSYSQNLIGMKFSTANRIYLDSVNFFTQDSAANYTIRLRYNGNTVASYNGVTNSQTPQFQNFTIGKTAINNLVNYPDAGTTDGLKIRNFYKVLIDSVTFYTGDSTATPYTVVVENAAGTTLKTINGTTKKNRVITTNSIIGKDIFSNAAATTSTGTANEGIRFINRQPVYLDSVTVYPSAAVGSTFQIVAKDVNDVVLSTSPVFTVTTNTSSQTVGLNMAVMAVDSVNGFKLEFLQNPGMRRDTASAPYPVSTGSLLSIADDGAGSSYNFFYRLKVNFKTYIQRVPLQFIPPTIDSTNGYVVRFTNNPGAKRDLAGGTYNNTIARKLTIINDSANGKHNYFYNVGVRLFSFRQSSQIKFVIATPDTTANSYELSFAPGGAIVETDSTFAGYLKSTPGDTLRFTKDTVQSRYGGIYGWDFRYGNYFKIYDTSTARRYFGISSLTPVYIDYPDTVNAQNVMDYTYCSKMFTHLQAFRMRTALEDPTAGRNNLIKEQNLKSTGIMDQNGNILGRVDLPMIADFSLPTNLVYTCATNMGPTTPPITFTNRSWNDTISAASWTFSNGATTPTSTSVTTVTNQRFGQPGWVNVQLDATSNVNGVAQTSTVVKDRALFIADPTAINPDGYYQEFSPGSDTNKYPIFNYFNNSHKWQIAAGAGYFDNYAMQYRNYDDRFTSPANLTGFPKGDYDDFFTPAFNVAGTGASTVYLNFFSAGAFRTNSTAKMLDTLEIAYSTNCGQTWFVLKNLMKGDIGNNGTFTNPFQPQWQGAWAPQSIALPTAARNSDRLFFRFRYKTGVPTGEVFGTGNHFYLDRISISPYTASVNEVVMQQNGMLLSPNPTTSGTTVMINSKVGKSADVRVTDITGKVVYQTTEVLNSNGVSSIEIPATVVSVKGVYMVHVVTGSNSFAEKLIVR